MSEAEIPQAERIWILPEVAWELSERPYYGYVDGYFASYTRTDLSEARIAQAREEGRREGLEEAAKVADAEARDFTEKADFYTPPRLDCDPYLENIHRQTGMGIAQAAQAIRALKETDK